MAMTPHFIKEFYQTSQHTIALIMTPERRALQAWCADQETGRMQRMDTLIMDIMHSDIPPINEASFIQFCEDNTVNPAIPERSILLSFKLAAHSLAQKSNIVPAPGFIQQARMQPSF
jgi:hypothetical protein